MDSLEVSRENPRGVSTIRRFNIVKDISNHSILPGISCVTCNNSFGPSLELTRSHVVAHCVCTIRSSNIAKDIINAIAFYLIAILGALQTGTLQVGSCGSSHQYGTLPRTGLHHQPGPVQGPAWVSTGKKLISPTRVKLSDSEDNPKDLPSSIIFGFVFQLSARRFPSMS